MTSLVRQFEREATDAGCDVRRTTAEGCEQLAALRGEPVSHPIRQVAPEE